MSGELDLIESQPALCAPGSDDTSARQSATVVLRVIRDEEWRVRVLLQPLLAVPGHVLQSQQRPVGGKEHVQVAAADDGVVGILDHSLQHAVLRWPDGLIGQVLIVRGAAEDIDVCALLPVGADRGIDRGLHVGAVEVDHFSWRYVVSDIDASED